MKRKGRMIEGRKAREEGRRKESQEKAGMEKERAWSVERKGRKAWERNIFCRKLKGR